MRILFAEDDRDLSRAVKALLEHAGYSVDVVYNGNDALEYAEGGNYDGMILDWMMPGQSGVQVLEKLRRQLVATPCLMLTARDAVEDRVTGLDAGADDYLAKPFATSELLARVRAMLRRRADYKPDVARFGDIELDRAEMEKYILSHLTYAGGSQDIFTSRALDEIFRASTGQKRAHRPQRVQCSFLQISLHLPQPLHLSR